jgi:hypothetical protein
MAEQKVKLTWDPKTNDVKADKAVDLKVGDVLVISSDQGTVNLKFDPPENFAMDQVINGTLQVRVLKSAPARITCGVVIKGVTHGFPVEKVKTGIPLIPAE